MHSLIITDIGGVLIRTDEAILTCIEEVFSEKGIPPGSKEELLSAFGTSIYDYILAYLPDEHKHRADECYAAFQERYPGTVMDELHPFPGADLALRRLKDVGHTLAVLSCMVKAEVEKNLSLLSFRDFSLIFALEDYEHKRPLPNGLRMIMERLGFTPAEAVYVGDTVNDIRMAKNAGVFSVAVRTGVQDAAALEAEKPDLLLGSFAELPDAI